VKKFTLKFPVGAADELGADRQGGESAATL
jgi:hypothetical protein